MAKIRVSAKLWESLSDNEQKLIKERLEKVGSIKPDDELISGPNIAAADGPCEMACTATYEAACVECASLGGGGVSAACYAAAAAAYGACLLACQLSGGD